MRGWMIELEHAVEKFIETERDQKIKTSRRLLLTRLGSRARAVAGDVSLGAASIARSYLGLWAVLGDVPCSAAIVALGALNAITGEMADSTTREAGLVATPTSSPTETSSSAVPTTPTGRGSIGASPRNVSDLAALVAFGIGRAAATTIATTRASATTALILGAVTRDMAGLVAFVARLRLCLHGTVARNVAVYAAVVAGGSAGLGALCSLVAD